MANQDAAFGMRPVGRIGGMPFTGGQSRYRIAANYGTSIFQGDMVAQVTGGTVEVHADGGTVPIVGVFNGRAEFGQRSLGSRSILADPRNKMSKNILNQKIKRRDWFMPFAPAIIEEKYKV